MKILYIIYLLLILTLFSSCSEHIVDYTPSVDLLVNSNIVKAKFSDIQSKVFNKSCALSGCHVTGVQAPNLSGNSYTVLVSKASTQGLNYIEPGSPNQSYLYKKLLNSNDSRMPLNAPQLNQSIIDSISAWILNGALNN